MRERVRLVLVSLLTLTAIVLLVPPSADGPVRAAIKGEGSQTPATKPTQVTTGAAKTRPMVSYNKLPLSFEPNQGQASGQVKFLSRGSGYTLFLTDDEAVLALRSSTKQSKEPGRIARPKPTKLDVLRMKLVGGNPVAQVVGLEELPGKSNYFIGKDPQQWRTNVPNYAKVRYQNVYPGIDLVYYGNQRQLEYDFVVAPGADPKAIALEIAGANGAAHSTIGKNGDLVITTKGGEVRFHKPVVYQAKSPSSPASSRKSTDGRFVLLGENRIGFKVLSYDRARPLYIDPVISYATYLGGSNTDKASGIAVDASDCVYVTGYTASTDFAATSGAFDSTFSAYTDAFVTKLSADGLTLVYSAFLGGSGRDIGYKIAVDASGNAHISGYTDSSDFPTVNAFQPHKGGNPCDSSPYMDPCYDSFMTKLNSNGSALLYSTYLGGSDFEDLAAIALDRAGNAYVAGGTTSSDFPTVNPIQGTFHNDCTIAGYGDTCEDGFVAKINPSAIGAASLVYSTYLGGNGSEYLASIAVDGDGNAYVTGFTDSTNFPTTPGAFNISGWGSFVTKINAAGSALAYSALIGGVGTAAIAVDASGNAYVTGIAGGNLPTTPGAFDTSCGTDALCNSASDGFVIKLNAAGSDLVYSTYLGGSLWDSPLSIAVDSMGIAYVAGETTSLDFPVRNGIYPTCHLGDGYCSDAFLTKLSAGGQGLIFSTYMGGSGEDFISGVAFDSSHNAYVAGVTSSTDFPVTSGAYKQTYGGSVDAFIVKLSDLALPAVIPSPQSLSFAKQIIGTTGSAQTVTVKNVGDAATAVLSFNSSGDFQLSQTCAAALAPDDGCTMDVTFTPTAAGTRTGEVKKYNEASGQWETFVSLTGVGVSPSLDVSSSSLTFADQLVGTTSTSQTVTLTNTGTNVVNFSSIQAATNFTHTTTCGNSLAVGANCTIDVTFAPKATGLLNEQITITHDAPGSPHAITLGGKGTDFSLMPASGTTTTSTVTAGAKATYNLSVSPTGFSGNVAMACKWISGQPQGTSCSVSPSTISLDGTNAADVAVTVSTTARSMAPIGWKPQPPAPDRFPVSQLALWLLALALVASLALRRRRAAVVLASVLFATVLWTACGGSASVVPISGTGTPQGTYSLSVAGTASSVTRSTTVTLVVK